MVEQRTHKPLAESSNLSPATKIVSRWSLVRIQPQTPEMKEIEAKFLEINPKKIQSELKSLGAKKIFDKTFREAIYLPPKGSKEFDDWLKKRKRVRIRDTGQEILLTVKVNKKWGLSETEEVEFEVSSFEEAERFLQQLDLVLLRYQEKRRISYQIDGVHVEIDFWPWVPAWLEIEADSEAKVKQVAKKLGLDWESAEFRDAAAVYEEVYSVDIFNIDRVSFDLPDPRK